MAIMRMRDMKEMDARTMAGKLAELKRELSIERSSAAGVGRAVNPGRIKTIKRTIARLLTLAKQKGFKLEAVAVAPAPVMAPSKPVQKKAPEAKPEAKAEGKPESKNVSPEFSDLIDEKASEKK